MNKTVETIGDATGETGWRKTYARKWTPPAQVCGAWSKRMNPPPEVVMQAALDAFGIDHQTDKCIEELGELATALIQYRQGRIGLDVLLGELADVQVTTGQLRLHYGATSVDQIVAVKLARLSRLCADQVALNAEKAKPVKPALRWEEDGDDLTLYDGEAVGWVTWWPQLAKWMGNPYGKTAMPCGDKADAKRHVEMACGFDEVPLWTP